MTKVVFPSFPDDTFRGYEIRQLVSALELRFQALEETTQSDLFDTGDDFSGLYAPIDHTHIESQITDLQDYLTDITAESIFDLSDVTGTPSHDDILVWNGSAFVAQPPGSAGSFALPDLTDVDNSLNPNDGDVLQFNSTSNVWESSAGSAVTSFFALTDTDLTSQSQYDMVFNATGSEWHDTAGALIWNPNNDYLQLANAHSVNWKDTIGASQEMLVFEEVGVAGTPMSYYVFYSDTDSTESGQTYVDTANGLDQAQVDMVNGDTYVIFTRAIMHNDNSSAANINGYRVIVNGAEMTGSEMLYEGIAGTAPVNYGNPYGYMGFFTANTAGTAVKTQHKRGSAGTNHVVSAETSFILNLDTDVPNHERDSSTTQVDVSDTGWVQTDAAVVLGAGDWVIFASAQFDQFNGANEPSVGINDGTTDIMLSGNVVEDSAADLYSCAGAYYLDSYAGGTVTVIASTWSASGSKITTYQAICALPLSDFSEAYGVQDTSATESNVAVQSVDEVVSTVAVTSIAGTGTNFVALGWATNEMANGNPQTSFEILEELNGGGDTLIGWDNINSNRKNTNANAWIGNTMVSSARSYSVGDAVDIKINAINMTAGYATNGFRYHGAALLGLQTASTNEEKFFVGDPNYPTRIDGTRIELANAEGINWEDVAADRYEFLNFEQTGTAGVALTHEVVQTESTYTATAGGGWENVTGATLASGSQNSGNDILLFGDIRINGTISSTLNDREVRLHDGTGAVTYSDARIEDEVNPSAGHGLGFMRKMTAGGGKDYHWEINAGATQNVNCYSTQLLAMDLTELGSSYQYSEDTTGVTDMTGANWTASTAAITFGDGVKNWLVFWCMQRQIDASGRQYAVRLDDGSSPVLVMQGESEDSAEMRTHSGFLTLAAPANATWTLQVQGETGFDTDDLLFASICAIDLDVFEDHAVEANTTNKSDWEANPGVAVTKTHVTATAATTDWACFGMFSASDWAAASGWGDAYLEVDDDGGGYTELTRPAIHDLWAFYNGHDTGSTTHNCFMGTQASVATGSSLTARVGHAAGAANHESNRHTMAMFTWQLTSGLVEKFFVGDPAFDTVIDGASVTVNHGADSVARTVTPASGGLEVNNTLTGAGFERVLTESDYDHPHTGEVTGTTALTLDVTAITNRGDVVADADDDVAIHDDSDGTIKKVNLSSITDAGYF